MACIDTTYGSCHQPVTLEIIGRRPCEHKRVSNTIETYAPSQRETEVQLIVDRLLREYLTPKSPEEANAVAGNLRNLHIAAHGSAV